MLKCIGIIVNLNKDITLDVTRLLIELLEKRGIEPLPVSYTHLTLPTIA